ncbi:MAG: YfcE family phosphodiesterase [Ruminococcaceae bacterium]|nr:YfcE family phosphodiesterase [Oscillospiraceae bacterium]
MRILVFSDTHGYTEHMKKAILSKNPDVVIHLGDYLRDSELMASNFPNIVFHSVLGNCDIGSPGEKELLLLAGSKRIFAAHGHTFAVKSGVHRLADYAAEKNADIALFGHTHRPHQMYIANVLLINPGSAGLGVCPTCAFLQFDGDKILKAEIQKL